MKYILGQHFLTSRKIIKRICDYADLKRDDVVYEIGAGFGNLTVEIARRVKKVYAIEIDPKLFEILKENTEDFDNVELIHGDAVIEEIPSDCNKVMGNIPFSISSLITEKVLRKLANCEIELALFMYQKEFAERILVPPGLKSFSRISFLAQYYSHPEMLEIIPRSFFRPIPKVDAALVKFNKKEGIKWDEKLNLFVKIIFSHKKKKVINAISPYLDKWKVKEKIKSKLLEKRVFDLEFKEIEELKNLFEKEFPELFRKDEAKD